MTATGVPEDAAARGISPFGDRRAPNSVTSDLGVNVRVCRRSRRSRRSSFARPAAGDAAPGDLGNAAPVACLDLVVGCEPGSTDGDYARGIQPIHEVCFIDAARWAELQHRERSTQCLHRRNTASRDGGKVLDGFPPMFESEKAL